MAKTSFAGREQVRVCLLVATLLSVANSAWAAERTYAFRVTATSGPLAGTLEDGRTATACAVLNAFIDQVDAHTGYQLSLEQATALKEAALVLAVVLGCSIE